jgi:hypothetical protein
MSALVRLLPEILFRQQLVELAQTLTFARDVKDTPRGFENVGKDLSKRI